MGTYTLKKQSVIGDWRVSFYTCTDFADAETVTVKPFKEIYFAKPNIGTNNVSVGVAIGTGENSNVITFDCGVNTYDGTLTIIGK